MQEKKLKYSAYLPHLTSTPRTQLHFRRVHYIFRLLFLNCSNIFCRLLFPLISHRNFLNAFFRNARTYYGTFWPYTKPRGKNSLAGKSENLWKNLSFPALKHPLPKIFPPFWNGGRSQKVLHSPKTLEQVIKQRQLEIAPSDAIFVYKISAARAIKVWGPG